MSPDPSPNLCKDTRARALTELMPALLARARRITSSAAEAEDLAQEALLRVWARLQGGAEIDDLAPYLMTVLRHAGHRRPAATAELTEAREPATPGAAPGRIACNDVAQSLARLPAEQAVLIDGLMRDGASYSELARREGVPVGTVMSRLARARARLRADLELEPGHAVDALLGITFDPPMSP